MKKLRKIKVKDIVHWNVDKGECFFDQNESIINVNVVLGFIIAKRPDLSIELLRHVNSQKFGFGLNDFIAFFKCEYPEIVNVEDVRYVEGYIKFTELFVQLINSTEEARKRVIKALDNKGEF